MTARDATLSGLLRVSTTVPLSKVEHSDEDGAEGGSIDEEVLVGDVDIGRSGDPNAEGGVSGVAMAAGGAIPLDRAR